MLWSKVFSSQSICIFSYFCSLWTDLGQKLCRSWMAKFYHVHKYSLCPIRHWRWWRVPLKALTINPHFMKLIRKGTWSSFFFFPFFLVRLGLSHFLNSIDLFPFAFVLLRLSRQACGSSLGCYQISISISISSSKKEKLNLHKREDYGVGGFLWCKSSFCLWCCSDFIIWLILDKKKYYIGKCDQKCLFKTFFKDF